LDLHFGPENPTGLCQDKLQAAQMLSCGGHHMCCMA